LLASESPALQMTSSKQVVKTKRKKTKNIQGKKWSSFKKLWKIYKIAKGEKDKATEIKTAQKLIKIAKGLKDKDGKQITIPSFTVLETK